MTLALALALTLALTLTLNPDPGPGPGPDPDPDPNLSASGKSTDMYKSAFGLLPELTDVLGDAEAAKRMLTGSLA